MLQQVWQKVTNFRSKTIIIILLLALVSCKTRQSGQSCSNNYDESYLGNVHIGDVYKIKGKTYIPKIDHQYNEIGLASWYGSAFHCKRTANGEVFNRHDYSAAHTTLPLPSVVRVTNLSNNKSTQVVVNDRGPFTKGRIIDLSERAAIAIGIKQQGIAKVRVEFLPFETNALMRKISSKKKIFYGQIPALNKFGIIAGHYESQKEALKVLNKLAKYGEIHLIHYSDVYIVVIISNSRSQANLLIKKLLRLGYKAKIAESS